MPAHLKIKPENYTTLSKCGKYNHYHHYRKAELKGGDIVYHKHTQTHKLICVDTPAKNKVLLLIKKKLTHTPEISVSELEVFLSLLGDPCHLSKFKDFIVGVSQ